MNKIKTIAAALLLAVSVSIAAIGGAQPAQATSGGCSYVTTQFVSGQPTAAHGHCTQLGPDHRRNGVYNWYVQVEVHCDGLGEVLLSNRVFVPNTWTSEPRCPIWQSHVPPYQEKVAYVVLIVATTFNCQCQTG